MVKFIRTFDDTGVRMVKSNHDGVLYSAYDVGVALGFENVRRAVNEAVMLTNGRFLNIIDWDGKPTLLMSSEYVIELLFNAEHGKAKKFIKWLLEVTEVAKRFSNENLNGNDYNYFATTQIAKKYGLTAAELNGILASQNIQYKVNNQWILYSNFQEFGYTKTVKVKKYGKDEFVLHTYWTSKGVDFVEGILKALGYRQQGEQLKLF